MKFVSDINDEIYGTIQLWEMEDSDEDKKDEIELQKAAGI